MATAEDVFLKRLDVLIKSDACPRKRIIVALAGAPGSGKSTVASTLTKRFNATNTEKLQVVPMDGFHLTKATLSRMPSDSCPFQRRGAPFTFDSDSFIQMVQQLSCTPVTELDEPESAIWAPKDDTLEGSYLLLDEYPWNLIRDLVSETWFLSVPRNISKERVAARHTKAGIEPNKQFAEARAEANDLLNWDLINRRLLDPDVTVESK